MLPIELEKEFSLRNLKFTLSDQKDRYVVSVIKTGSKICQLFMVDSGEYMASFYNNAGMWNGHILIEIGEGINRINKPLDDHLDDYLKEQGYV